MEDFKLLSGRILVLADDDSDTTGVIVQQDLDGFRGLTKTPGPVGEDEPSLPAEYHVHIVFVKEMAVEVEINGVAHLAMHRNAIVGTVSP